MFIRIRKKECPERAQVLDSSIKQDLITNIPFSGFTSYSKSNLYRDSQ